MENNEDITKNFPKGDPFKVPDGFFDHFQEEIQARVTRRLMPVSLMQKIRQPLKLAASFALLVVFSWLVVLLIQYSRPYSPTANTDITDTLGYDYSFVDEDVAAAVMADTSAAIPLQADAMVDFLLERNVSYELLADYY
jgi:hypothetical protein